MCYPAIQNVDINLWGYVVNTTYTSTFLPILFGLLAAVPLYKWFDKVLPKMIKGFMTPMLTLIIIFPLTFIVIGPLANMIGAGLNVVLTSICEFSPLLAGLILGGCWQILYCSVSMVFLQFLRLWICSQEIQASCWHFPTVHPLLHAEFCSQSS